MALDVSADGRRLVAADASGVVAEWDVATGAHLSSGMSSLPGVTLVRYAPGDDGTLVAASPSALIRARAEVGRLDVRDVASARWSRAAASPDGRVWLLESDAGRESWDVRQGARLAMAETARPERALALAMGAGGSAAVALLPGGIIDWNATGAPRRTPIAGDAATQAVSIVLTGTDRAVVGGPLGAFECGPSGEARRLLGIPGPVVGLQYDDASGLLVIACAEEVVVLRTASEVRRWRPRLRDGEAITALRAGPGADLVSVGTSEGEIRVWRTRPDPHEDAAPVRAGIAWSAVSANGGYLAVGGSERVLLWDLSRPAPPVVVPTSERPKAVSDDGAALVTVSRTRTLAVWKTRADAPPRKLDLPAIERVCDAGFLDAERVWIVCEDPPVERTSNAPIPRAPFASVVTLRLSGPELTAIDPGRGAAAGALVSAAAGVALGGQGRVGVQSLRDRASCVWSDWDGRWGWVTLLAAGSDGSIAAAHVGDGWVRIWPCGLVTEPGAVALADGPITALATAGVPALVAAGQKEGIVVLFDAGGRRVWRGEHARLKEIVSLGFTTSGARLVSSDADGGVTVWNVLRSATETR